MAARNSEIPEILFVCLGNICRSNAAQTILADIARQEGVALEVDSAGTYGGHAGQGADRRMKIHARQRGYELTHRARRVRESDFEEFDVIVAMDDNNLYDLRAMAPTPEAEKKLRRMVEYMRHPGAYTYVPDPYYEGAEGFELVLDMLEDGCRSIVDRIKNNQPL